MGKTAPYKDPIVQKVIDYLNASGPTQLRNKYSHGDIIAAPRSQMPIAYVAKDNTEVAPADNMEDEHTMPMVVGVIYNMTRDLNQSAEVQAGVNALYDICEGRDADYSLRTDSLLYQLGLHMQLDDKLWLGVGTPVSVDYGIGVERRGPGIFSTEAVIRFTVRLHTPRPGL